MEDVQEYRTLLVPEKADKLDELDRKTPGVAPGKIPIGPGCYLLYNTKTAKCELWVRNVKQTQWPT